MPPPVVEAPAISGVESTREETRKWIAYIALSGFFLLLGLILMLDGFGRVGLLKILRRY
jgi:hypothetical protein